MISKAIRLITALATVNLATLALGGDLSPSGAPAPTPGPEPRIAINDVNTPGNDDSYFRITEPGSYHLEDNLIIPGTEPKHGILIETSDVTLDLGGFTLDGWNPVDVPHPNSSLRGIMASGERENITVRNGIVRDWGQTGVDLANTQSGLVECVTASDNGAGGIVCGDNSLVTRCVAENNDGVTLPRWAGISVGVGSAVTDCVSTANEDKGISASIGSSVSECTVSSNGGLGIFVSQSSTVSHCTATRNIDDGISASVYSLVIGCEASQNQGAGVDASERCAILDCSITRNSGDGIQAGAGSRIVGNTCGLNGWQNGTGVGITVNGNDATIDGNTVNRNDEGIVVTGSNHLIIRNHAADNGSSTADNFNITGTHILGPTIGSTGTIGSNSPWANFSF